MGRTVYCRYVGIPDRDVVERAREPRPELEEVRVPDCVVRAVDETDLQRAHPGRVGLRVEDDEVRDRDAQRLPLGQPDEPERCGLLVDLADCAAERRQPKRERNDGERAGDRQERAGIGHLGHGVGLLRRRFHGPRRSPRLTTLHGTDITLLGSDRSYSETVAFCIQQSDGVTAVSQSLKNDTIRELGITRDIRVIPNFLDCSVYRRLDVGELCERLAPGHQKLLIHVSNFRPVKRTKEVVQSSRASAAKSRRGC